MEFKGTKGKWEVNKGNNVVSKHNLPIAIVYDGYTPHGSFKNEDEKDRKANALLISKAPEMLEMLQFINSDFEVWESLPSKLQERIYELIKQATEI